MSWTDPAAPYVPDLLVQAMLYFLVNLAPSLLSRGLEVRQVYQR